MVIICWPNSTGIVSPDQNNESPFLIQLVTLFRNLEILSSYVSLFFTDVEKNLTRMIFVSGKLKLLAVEFSKGNTHSHFIIWQLFRNLYSCHTSNNSPDDAYKSFCPVIDSFSTDTMTTCEFSPGTFQSNVRTASLPFDWCATSHLKLRCKDLILANFVSDIILRLQTLFLRNRAVLFCFHSHTSVGRVGDTMLPVRQQ